MLIFTKCRFDPRESPVTKNLFVYFVLVVAIYYFKEN